MPTRIDTKCLKAVFGEERDEPLHGQKCDDKGYDAPECQHQKVITCGPTGVCFVTEE